MALVQKVTTSAIQGELDRFANAFLDLELLARSLVAFRANLQDPATVAAWVTGDDGQPLAPAVLAELTARLGALQTFVTWANAGNPSPVAYLVAAKRSV